MLDYKMLSGLLYVNDPANTCCVENEATDEYDHIASELLDRINKGIRSVDALEVTLDDLMEEFFMIEGDYRELAREINSLIKRVS